MSAACPAAVILVIAASGGLGSRVTLQALAAGHTVNVLVRSHDKLSHAIGASNVSKLGTITIGSAVDIPVLQRAMASCTTVVECLGNADRAPDALRAVQRAALDHQNVFASLMEATKVCTLGQISRALYEVGGQYRRNM
jgi:methylmalonyl-CoA mutase N-terminal domain/subunit